MRWFYVSVFMLSVCVGTVSGAIREVNGIHVQTGKLASYQVQDKRPLVVIFLSTQCPCAVGHEKKIKSLAHTFSEFRFVGVYSNASETLSEIKAHITQSQFSFPIIQDIKSAMADALGALRTPHAVVIDVNGQILFRGGVDNSRVTEQATKHYLYDALLALTQGEKNMKREEKVFGCLIER